MHIISMLFLPVLFLLSSGVLRGASAVESVPTFEHRDSSTGETLVCNKCPPGTHMASYCTPTTPTVCVPCRSQHFTELWNYLPKCLYCYNFCTENQEVETECTATSNRVCRCKEGFYLTADFCRRQSECGPGQGVQTIGTPQTNTVCETCSNGYFSTSSSALESCVKQQECATGQIALLSGSTSHDTMCGSCEDLANGGETLKTFFSGFFRMHRMRVVKMKRFVARYIHKSGDGTLPKQRGPLLDHIIAWVAQAPEEQLRALPTMLKDSELCSITEKLEKIVDDIKQQSPNCTLTL
ncbi:tumor necrosis factor receptor superfamily member 6B-like [Sebastes umbrosus]|uniref:tumor necrosis factor receptor superfamily member 6B-like n=1 Tax=Sebastes umbrosus TaxID=72105 RepID=UPI00189DE79F|nr:tumor necrosis factor receptor superfamily member 6B-like [Sebastes umbrosus]